MTLKIEPVADGTTLEVTDAIERRKVSLRFPSSVSPEPAEADSFVYPVDRAVAVTAESVSVDGGSLATILDESGAVETAFESNSETIPPGTYYLNVSDHVKTYLWVDAPEGIEVEKDDETTTVRLDFATDVRVRIGVRSKHEHPEATITTSPAPEDVMRAVSYLGSALKDTGPMRSFPSIRGHPPEIELGSELDVPEELEKPETGVTIEIPPSYEYVYPVASLSYYLGAEVVPGDEPVLRTDEGFTYPLDGPDGFERSVERLLKHVFTCDCFVRAGGPYSYDLTDREAFVRDTGLDPEEVYDRPLAAQVEAYLGVPFEDVEPYVPEWGCAAHLDHLPANVEYLPFLANDLAVVRSPAVREVATAERATANAEHALVDGEFTRSTTVTGLSTTGPATPSSPGSPAEPSIETDEITYAPVTWPGSPPPIVSPEPLDAQEQFWIADGIPLGADRPTLESYRNALERDPVEGEIEIIVVCNDDRMADEDKTVRELLSARTPFDVHIRPYRNVLTDELRELLKEGADFLHYIGHIDDQGFACPDGHLDTSTLDTVAVDAFFLNACRSYEQGRALIDAGAIAGVVTLDDVQNSDAVRAGRLMARLLNNGFPLNTALEVASAEHDIRDQYTIAGDGGLQIAQAESNAHLIDADRIGEETFEYDHQSFVTPQFQLGSAYTPTIDGINGWHLVGDEISARVSREALYESFAYEDAPIRINDEFGWSTDIADRLPVIETYRSDLEELAEVAIEFGEFESRRPEDRQYHEVQARFEELRERVETTVNDFESEDFHHALRTVLVDGEE